MAGKNVRWRNIREFLDDLPKEHCLSKPGHEFCTVCMRINYLVAQDCPLLHQKPKKKRKLPPPPPPEARPEPIKDHISTDDVRQAMKGEDFPIIEFAGPRGTGGHDKEEEIFEVKPLDVKPMAAPPPEALTRPAKKEEKEETKAATAKPATAVADRDPETIVQEIMEELEFPDEDVLEDEVESEKEPSKDDEKEGDDETTPDNKGEGQDDGPPVVEKEAVKKRRPKKVS
jgi:hypothetical protein